MRCIFDEEDERVLLCQILVPLVPKIYRETEIQRYGSKRGERGQGGRERRRREAEEEEVKDAEKEEDRKRRIRRRANEPQVMKKTDDSNCTTTMKTTTTTATTVAYNNKLNSNKKHWRVSSLRKFYTLHFYSMDVIRHLCTT